MRFIAKKTLEAAKESGNDAIVQVKGNQKTLLKDCQTIAATTEPDDVYQESMSNSRNRLERRTAELFFYPLLTDYKVWGLVKVVIKVTRFRRVYVPQIKSWRDSDEVSFYISTIDLNAEQFCQAIRRHWHCENKNHYVRDVTLGEDKSRIRVNPHIFAKLRSFALNILRANHAENVSAELFDNCMDLNRVLNYSGVL
jgi:predicted transposase YbfD/YdcC